MKLIKAILERKDDIRITILYSFFNAKDMEN